MCCPKCPCETCQTVHFDIKDDAGENLGLLDKRTRGCMKAMVSDADNFMCEFPKSCTQEERALLLAGTLFLDYMFFED